MITAAFLLDMVGRRRLSCCYNGSAYVVVFALPRKMHADVAEADMILYISHGHNGEYQKGDVVTS